MLDKIDVLAPNLMPFSEPFRRVWSNPEHAEILRKKTNVGLYAVTADLRGVGIPLRLSCGHKHHPKLGPKVEILGVGDSFYSSWVETLKQVFSGDVEECSLLRVDTTADIEGWTVDELSKAHWCKHKRTNQDIGLVEGEPFRRLSRLSAQTIYHGLKPRQIRIYNKTLHRLKVLLPAINRDRRRHCLPALSFLDVYGYDAEKVITRIERQMGAREPEEIWGIRYLGQIPQLMKCDPFAPLRLAEESNVMAGLDSLDPIMRFAITELRSRIASDGVDWTRSYLRSFYPIANSFRQTWARYEPLLMAREHTLSAQQITAKFHESLRQQLAA